VTKGPEAFRTISEAAEELGVPQHVLRFWETKFSFIRPMKRAGGRRFYRPQDLAVLKGVRVLLHDDGYTIKGVQRLHKELGVKRLLAAGDGGAADDAAAVSAPASGDDGLAPTAKAAPAPPLAPESDHRLRDALDALEAAKARLARALAGG
jgi:DNA-binding transcriptional MerR regulator